MQPLTNPQQALGNQSIQARPCQSCAHSWFSGVPWAWAPYQKDSKSHKMEGKTKSNQIKIEQDCNPESLQYSRNMLVNSFILCSMELPGKISCRMLTADAANPFPIPREIVWNKSILWKSSFRSESCMRIWVWRGSSSQGGSTPIVARNDGQSLDLSWPKQYK